MVRTATIGLTVNIITAALIAYSLLGKLKLTCTIISTTATASFYAHTTQSRIFKHSDSVEAKPKVQPPPQQKMNPEVWTLQNLLTVFEAMHALMNCTLALLINRIKLSVCPCSLLSVLLLVYLCKIQKKPQKPTQNLDKGSTSAVHENRPGGACKREAIDCEDVLGCSRVKLGMLIFILGFYGVLYRLWQKG